MGCGPKAAYDDEQEELEDKTWKKFQALSRADALSLIYDIRRLLRHVDETPQHGYIHSESNSLAAFLTIRGL